MKHILSYLCCAIMMTSICHAYLQAEVKDNQSSSIAKCTKEELMTFFPQPVVQSVLIQANIPQEEATEIAKELSYKNTDLVKQVEEKASKLNPNPFKDLSQRDLAIRIYRETLYEVFAKVLKAHGVTNEDQIQTLLDEMQVAKSKLFIDCIRKQQTTSLPSSSSS